MDTSSDMQGGIHIVNYLFSIILCTFFFSLHLSLSVQVVACIDSLDLEKNIFYKPD